MQNKHNSFPSGDYMSEQAQRLSPLEKVMSSESLSYLPNLYFRKYKLIESLNYERYEFPEQKILVPRQKTSWDAVLCQMTEKAHLRKEMQKFKIAQNFHISREAKQEFLKKELKREQRELFHRIIANQLAQQVRDSFSKFKPNTQEQNLPNGVSSKHEPNPEDNKKGRNQDQIFINPDQAEDPQMSQQKGYDVFDDLLNDGIDQKGPLVGMLSGREENANLERIQGPPRKSIRQYMSSYVNLEEIKKAEVQKGAMEEQEQPTQKDKKLLISRKQCLKKINENLRKRLKTKATESDQRSLTSATVSLSNLINNHPETKTGQDQALIDLPNKTEWLFEELSRPKRRRDQEFDLKWPKEQLQKFYNRNGDKFQLSKLKQSPLALQLYISAKQYPKLFQRNIATDSEFPSSLSQVKDFSNKFNKRKFYYNEFHDKFYEKFVMKNNKRKLLSQFQKNSNYMFAEHYVQEEIEDEEKVTMGKIFLYPPSKLSQRLVYKVSPGTTKVTAVAKGYSKKTVPMSRQKTLLMSFLMQKYLAGFGNNWKAITEFIQIFPAFSSYLIRPQLVQEVYQLINRHQLKADNLDNLQIWDKKLLPSRQMYKGSYKNLKDLQRQKQQQAKEMIQLQSEGQWTQSGYYNQEKQLEDQETDVNPDEYERLLDEPLRVREKDQKVFKKLSHNYKEYGRKLFSRTTNETYNFYQNKVQKANKVIEEYRNTFLPVKVDSPPHPENAEQVVKFVQEVMKPQVKTGLPFRKKKNINERNNELVKILQALKSKNSMQSGSNKGPETNKNLAMMSNKMASGPGPAHMASSQSLANKGTDSQGEKEQKKSKAPEKRVGGSVKKRKKEGQQEKK